LAAEKNLAAEKVALQDLTRGPQELTCRGSCPNRCAPQCDITCCETKPQTKTLPLIDTKAPKSCPGDCLNLCAPLCRGSCCARHKKSSVRPPSNGALATVETPPKSVVVNFAPQPFAGNICPAPCQGKCTANCPQVCCTEATATNSYYVRPLTSSATQCNSACDQRCAPSCTPQCCMQYNRGFAQLPQPQYYGPQQPANPYAPAYPAPMPPQPGYAQHQPAVARDGAQPMVVGQTLEVEVPNMRYNKNNPQTAYQRVYPGGVGTGVPPGCPASCARTCDARCKLGCCATAPPQAQPPMYFSTQQVNDVDQRRTYEMLLQKYRNNQLQKYYHSSTRNFVG
jgi:hypothetical protein